MGYNNQKFEYEMGGNKLKSVDQEKDLGVLNVNGKFAEQCSAAAKKANQILGMIRRNIKYKKKEIIVKLYKALVRPRLEYCVQAWSPYLII